MPSRRGRRACEITAFSESETIWRICPCRSAGNALMIRSTVAAAVVV
jgi:hypothetical protein